MDRARVGLGERQGLRFDSDVETICSYNIVKGQSMTDEKRTERTCCGEAAVE